MRDNKMAVKAGLLLMSLLLFGIFFLGLFVSRSATTGTVAAGGDSVLMMPVLMITLLLLIVGIGVLFWMRTAGTQRKRKDEVSEEAYRYVEELIDQGVVRLVDADEPSDDELSDDEELPELKADDLYHGEGQSDQSEDDL